MKKFSLLYVDDEEGNLIIFKDTFRRKFNVFTATSAMEGMKILDNNEIDLVLSDQRMPKMTGVEFLKHSLEKYPEPNRILITGHSDIDAIENAINSARIFQYIQKPWKTEKLTGVIEEALNIYQSEKDKVEHQNELKIAKEKAEGSDQLKTEFINNLSHEIRTPMNAIVGFTGMLEDDELETKDRKNYLTIIKNSVAQLLRIIDDILEISMLGSNKSTVLEKEVCLNHVLHEQYEIFDIKAKENKIPFYLKMELSDNESIIHTDESRLNKILSNLLENALKFTDNGSIELGYRILDETIEIYIRDTGIGIHEDNLDIIFEKFSQENKETSQKYGGIGLGLSIAKENTILLGGEIAVQSKKGEGSTFYVKFPFVKLQGKKEVEKTQVSQKNSNNYTILVAEDEELNYFVLEIILKKNFTNLTLLQARDGIQALEICNQNSNIDLVLMDLRMPGMDGFEATEKIKKIIPNVPIVAQSAYTTNEDKEKAFASGCDNFLSKPINEKSLIEMINKYLSSH
jgi:signal transduction histidine kinase